MHELAQGLLGSVGVRRVQLHRLRVSSTRPYSLARLAHLFRCFRQIIQRAMKQIALLPLAEVEP